MPKAQRRAERLAAQEAYNQTPEGQAELARKMEEKKRRKKFKYDRNKEKNKASSGSGSGNSAGSSAGSDGKPDCKKEGTTVIPKPPTTKKELKRQKQIRKAVKKAELIATICQPGWTKYQIRKALQAHKHRTKEQKLTSKGGKDESIQEDTTTMDETTVVEELKTEQTMQGFNPDDSSSPGTDKNTEAKSVVEDENFIPFSVDCNTTAENLNVKKSKKRPAPVDEVITVTDESSNSIQVENTVSEPKAKKRKKEKKAKKEKV